MDEADEEGEWSDDRDPKVNNNAENFEGLSIQHREVRREKGWFKREDIFPTS